MSIERNKSMACEFLDALAVHDAVRGAALLHDDLVYWTCGKPHLFPYAGERGKTANIWQRPVFLSVVVR
jgi:ketosteroid isomerase-like protein